MRVPVLCVSLLLLHVPQLGDSAAAQQADDSPSFTEVLQLFGLAGMRAQVTSLTQQGKSAEAIPLAKQVVERARKLVGENHAAYAGCLNDLAELYRDQADYEQAEPLYRRALQVMEKVGGEEKPEHAVVLNNLALNCAGKGDYAQAERLLLQSLAAKRKVLKQYASDLNYSGTLNNLAELYLNVGDYTRAESLCREAIEVTKRGHGERQLVYAINLDTLAKVGAAIGDFDRAERLLRESHDILTKLVGENHPLYLTSLQNLAAICESKGDYDRANKLYRQALTAEEKVLGTDHQMRAVTLDCLASEHSRLKQYEQAVPLVREAMEVRKRVLGQDHPEYAVSVNNLARMYQDMGDYARAEPLYRKALAILRSTVGERHSFYLIVLSNLASEYECIGDERQAELLLGQCAETAFENLGLVADVLSERQQLVMVQHLRGQLDDYLSASLRVGRGTEKAYAFVLRWKGIVFTRQRLLRLARESPTLKRELAELQQINRQLAQHAVSTPPSGQHIGWHREMERLLDRREDLERTLARGSDAYRDNRASPRITASEIRSILPPRAALVDILEYEHRTVPLQSSTESNPERRVVAFVSRCDRPTQQVDLGPQSPIAAIVAQWRKDLAAKRQSQDKEDPAIKLRKLVWEPLEKQIEGAEMVLLAPEGVLSQIPWAALPGKQADRYLLEDFTIAIIPVPQLLPQILSTTQAAETGNPPPNNMFLVGNVDFDASAVQPAGVNAQQGVSVGLSAAATRAARDGGGPTFAPLPGSTKEIYEIAQTFQQAYPRGSFRVLERGQATKQAFREEAGLYSYIHIATHGVFAPERMKPATTVADNLIRFVSGGAPTENVVGWHPGLLSGLAFAGANAKGASRQGEGILTALEVADLDLHKADMVVLSACDTGLGKMAGGEGLLGLQRAFQLSGARTVVASLWQVDDRVTRELMERFYVNLWQKQLQPAEALRQAQLSILHSGIPVTIERGISQPIRLPEGDRSVVAQGPHLWAAWVLSGYPGDLKVLGNNSIITVRHAQSQADIANNELPGNNSASALITHVPWPAGVAVTTCVVLLTIVCLRRIRRSR